MKKSLLFIFVFAISFLNSQEVMHINFDDINPDVTFQSWNNSSTFALTTNPIIDPTNFSLNVGQFFAGSDNSVGIGVVNPATVFPIAFDLTQSSQFKIKFLAGEAVTISLKIENQPDYGPHNSITTATYDATQIGTWQELTFDFGDYSDIFINNIVIYVDGDNWEEGDSLYFDEIAGPPLYTDPAFEFTPADMATDISIGGNMVIETNDKFYGPGAVTITDFSNKVALRLGDENGADVPFEATIESDSKITISSIADLDFQTTYWFGTIANSMYHSNGMPVIGAAASFTTKDPVSGDINIMMFDFETDETDTPFVSWQATGFAQIPNPEPDLVNNSSNVGQYTHTGISWSNNGAGIESEGTFEYIDFAETPFFRMKVWVDKPLNVVFKLQNNPSHGQNSEVVYAISEEQTNQWTQLEFNFSGVTASNYNRVQIWFDGDTGGGSVAGDVYYFDDIEKTNVAPAAEVTFNPANGDTEVLQYAELSIKSNFQFVNLDGSDISDPTAKLELRENNSNGALVPFEALVSDDNNTFIIVPNELLSSGSNYWYGVKEGVVKYDETQMTVSDLSATFTVSDAGLPEMTLYNDFEGNGESILTQALGDPASFFNLAAIDPMGGPNTVMEWQKGESWSGWERIHVQLSAPFDETLGDLFSFRVFSSDVTGIRFKLADAQDDWEQTGNYETGPDSDTFPDKNILVTNQWQTYYFNISDLADGVSYDHLFIFLGRGENEAGVDETFYVDDIMGPALQTTAGLDELDNNVVKLYPNPANNIVYFKNMPGEKTIKVRDVNGRLISQIKTDLDEFSVAHLNPGFYFLEINGQTKKFIKK